MLGEAVIEVRGLTHRLGGRTVLHNVDLILSERRIGLVGRNGSGKSTLVRSLAGLITPDQGTVTIGRFDVAKDRRAAIRHVGVLFQNPDHQIIFPTVGEEIAFGLQQLGQTREQVLYGVETMLARFDRTAWHDRAVSELSQGQRHLVCLMSVLAMTPSVIILDEPFAGLDIPTTLQLRRVLDSIAQRVIQVSHDPLALAKYDRIIWIEKGGVRADGPPETVFQKFMRFMTEDQDASSDLID